MSMNTFAIPSVHRALLALCVAFSLCGCRAILDAFTPSGRDPQAPRKMKGSWCSLGTSITWYNDNVAVAKGRFTTGYQTYVMKTLTFDGFINRGVNGGCIANQCGQISKADYYTIEHGVNDWGHSTPVGTLDDYLDNTSNKTFCASYRRVVDEIRALNPKAKIVVCTPRRAFGFNGYLPESWYLAMNGIKLEDYAKAVRAIAEAEGFVVADFFKNSGHNENQLRLSCIDEALHPNDLGYQIMANEVLRAFAKVD